MNRSIYTSALMITLSILLPASYAAKPWSITRVPIGEVERYIPRHQTSLVHQNSTTLDELYQVEEHMDAEGVKHARLQQYYAGVPVWGAYVVLRHTHKKNQLAGDAYLHGLLYRDIKSDLADKSSDVVSRGTLALASLKARYKNKTVSEETVVPMIYIDDHHRAHWAYQVSFLVEENNHHPARPTAIMDSVTLESYLSWNDIKTLMKAKGQGYGGNLRTNKIQYGQGDKPLLDIMRDPFSGVCTMQNQYVSIFDMGFQYSGPAQLAAFECSTPQDAYWTGLNQDGYDAINEAYSPWNDALYIGTVVHDMYANWYGVNALGTAKNPKVLMMRVHYGKEYENAFWDGKQMTFGDGGVKYYPLVALSVGAHEVSHGFTEHHSDLAYVDQSGGINEAFSDMAAQAAEYYVGSKNSWMIGNEVIKTKSKMHAIRYMDNPTHDGKSIAHVNQYRPGLDVHHLSGVYNRFFYLLANHSGWNTRQAFHVMLKANMDYWVPTTNYADGACGVLWAAEDLELPLRAIKDSFQDVGISTEKC